MMSWRDTLKRPGVRDPETGKVMGVKIGPCRGCGKQRQISVATGLCGVKACRNRAERLEARDRKRAEDREAARLQAVRADEWLANKVLIGAEVEATATTPTDDDTPPAAA